MKGENCMDIIEFAEKLSGKKLSESHNKIFTAFEAARREGNPLRITGGRISGKMQVRRIIDEWEKVNGIKHTVLHFSDHDNGTSVFVKSISKEPIVSGSTPISVKSIIELMNPVEIPETEFHISFDSFPEKVFYPARKPEWSDYCTWFIEM
jgi:hypothetical protein